MNQVIKPLILSFFLFIFFYSGNAQFSEKLFYDTLTKVSSEGYVHSASTDGKFIYIAGGSFSDKSPLPTLTKIDTSGYVYWTAIDNDNYGRFGNYTGGENVRASCREIIKSGNRLYTNVRGIGTFFSPQLNEVWCISDSTGVLMWKTSINNKAIERLVDYSSTELIAITGTYNFEYHLINKNSGAVTFSKHFGFGDFNNNFPNVFVDNSQNILLSWEDTCRKFRDKFLTQLAWTSHVPNMGSRTMIDKVIQDSSRYIFLGRNNVRSVDTLTGNTIWHKRVQVGFVLGSQSGSDGDPKDVILKDSLIYVTWVSPYVGGVNLEKGFTMTRLNKLNGFIGLNVAYDFNGIPADPVPNLNDDLDWPFQMSMDESKNIYITGSYDRDPGMQSPGNWGIMKIHGTTGSKLYEATITDDSTRRQLHSQGRFIYYYKGRMYSAGNLSKKEDFLEGTKPIIVSFDTSSVFNQLSRKSVDCFVRYPSSLVGMTNLGANKMILLKKVGRSGIVEVRNTFDQLLWSKRFTTIGKYIVPQNVENLSDTSIAVSFISYRQDTVTKMIIGKPDSLLFVRLDTLGNIKFQHTIRYLNTDTLSALQIYKDPGGRTNFFFKNKNGNQYGTKAYLLDSTSATLSSLGSLQPYDLDSTTIKIKPVQHYFGDTMIVYQTGSLSSRGWLYSNTQTASNYSNFGVRLVRDFAKIYSALKIDSVSFFITGRDSSGRIIGARYNHRLPNPKVWTYFGANGSMYNADMAPLSIYTVSKNYNGNKLSIAKLNRQNGSISWTTEKTPAIKTNILPVDIKYDSINRYFITGGVIADSSISGIKTSYFYFTVDSLGNTIKDVVKTGYGLSETKINAVNVLQNGTHAYGGVISTNEWGIAGFYNSDCFVNNLIPTVSINTPAINICSGSSVTFTASATNEGSSPVYQWQVNGNNVGINANFFTTSTLNNNDQVKVMLTSNANCIQVTSATSNIITVTVSTQGSSVSIAGITNVNQGQNTVITATPLNGGSTPTYQWQDSTNTHTWQNIVGATGNTITYTPALTGNKIRCAMTGNGICSTPGSVLSNALTFTVNSVTAINPVQAVDYGIIYYPNPASGFLIIDSLKLSDKWETLKIISIDGKHQHMSINIRNQRKIRVDVAHLADGLYAAILYRYQKDAVYLKFMKLQ